MAEKKESILKPGVRGSESFHNGIFYMPITEILRGNTYIYRVSLFDCCKYLDGSLKLKSIDPRKDDRFKNIYWSSRFREYSSYSTTIVADFSSTDLELFIEFLEKFSKLKAFI